MMSDCVVPLIAVMAKSIEDEDDDAVLKSVVELAEKSPQFLRPQFEPLMQLCLKVLAEPDKADTWKHLALEVIISLSENAPSTVRKRGSSYLPNLGMFLIFSAFFFDIAFFFISFST